MFVPTAKTRVQAPIFQGFGNQFPVLALVRLDRPSEHLVLQHMRPGCERNWGAKAVPARGGSVEVCLTQQKDETGDGGSTSSFRHFLYFFPAAIFFCELLLSKVGSMPVGKFRTSTVTSSPSDVRALGCRCL